jgi:hypothetical protein
MDGWQTTTVFLPLFFSQIVARLYLRHANPARFSGASRC